ncbi:MAG: dihydroneopterin aldolase [Ignavibacteriota bacterium]
MIIRVTGLKLFAHHGVYEEEIRVGNNFEIDIEVEVVVSKERSDDELSYTLDYVMLCRVVKQVSDSKRYNLLETFSTDICGRIMEEFEKALSVKVRVRKMKPPVGAEVEYVEIENTERRVDA